MAYFYQHEKIEHWQLFFQNNSFFLSIRQYFFRYAISQQVCMIAVIFENMKNEEKTHELQIFQFNQFKFEL